jgi:hypothetical protein
MEKVGKTLAEFFGNTVKKEGHGLNPVGSRLGAD